MSHGFVGTGRLLKVALRQEVRNIVPWIVLITGLSASSVLAYDRVFPDAQSRAELAATLGSNPALALVFGPARDLMTADGFNAWRAGALGGFFTALMAIFIVVRNSRADEDSGRAELLASGVMGRQARPAVALAMAWIASTALGLVTWGVTVAAGGGVTNSLALAATFTASGLMFAGVAGIAAQLGSDARTANSIAVAVLGSAFIGRGYVDASGAPEWAAWLTPLGWLGKVQPGTGNNGWPLLLALALAAVLAGGVFAIHARRDFGLGVVAPRRGPARGGWVASIGGLAVRTNRGQIVSWTLAFVVLGAVFGFLATSLSDVLSGNPSMGGLIASGATTHEGMLFEFLVTLLRLVAIIAAVFGVQLVMRVYAEEIDYRVEPLLAASVSRFAHLASVAVIAFIAPAAALLIAGTIIGIVAAGVEPAIAAGDVITQTMATVPAVWVLVAVSLAAVGAQPRIRVVGWFGVVATFALTILGPLFQLSDGVLGISPLWHVPNVTAATLDWSGLGWVGLITVGLVAVAFGGYRRRDIA